MTNDNRSLGQVIYDARMKLKLSLRQAAKLLEITPSYLSDIENDRRVPSEDVLRRISALLKLDQDDMMARAGRLGDDALRYMMQTPAVGMLFRKLAEKRTPGETVKELFDIANKTAEKKKGQDR
jgi:transcriptional regulator with XRE-family HTH domain